MPEITREMYKKIKRFDREQFKSFCKELYCYGFEDGASSVKGTDLNEIYELIAATKGIGPQKYKDIVNNIENAFDGKAERW